MAGTLGSLLRVGGPEPSSLCPAGLYGLMPLFSNKSLIIFYYCQMVSIR